MVEVALDPELVMGGRLRRRTLVHREPARAARSGARAGRRGDGRRMTSSATTALTTQPDPRERALLRSVVPRRASPMPSVNAWVPAPRPRAYARIIQARWAGMSRRRIAAKPNTRKAA